MLCPIQASAVQLECADRHRLKLHLGLPFIDLGVRFEQNAVQKFVSSELNQPALGVDELRGTEAFRTLGGNNEAAARLQNIDRTYHALDGLVVGAVQRITCRAGHDGLESAFYG